MDKTDAGADPQTVATPTSKAKPAPQPIATPKADAAEALIQTWFEANIYNTAYSRDAELYNRLFASKEELKQKVRDAIGAA